VAGVELDDAGDMHGECSDDYSGCAYSEDLFLDGTMLWHVTSRSEVGLGTWYIDYDDGLVYIADNPEGREVELSVLDSAFSGDARDVTIRGLTVEKYANAAQTGAIHAKDDESLGEGWLLEGNEIRLNHGGGIRLGPGMQVLNNFVHHNGQIGISGGEGDGIVIEGNEISFNNTAGFSWGWEAGGTKFVRTQNLVVRANHVHHNKGPGLWTDISNIHTLYEDNLVEANENMGIFHEISYDAVIRNNTVRDNGLVDHEWLLGAGILVAASRNVEVYGNTVTGNGDGIAAIQQDRGDGDYGPLQVINLYVHDNTISMTIGETGLAQDIDDDSYFRDRGNRFERNTYRLGQEENYYSWADGSRSKDEWQAFGNDTDGQWLSDAP
jgi:parallel beta-helix repeat protein